MGSPVAGAQSLGAAHSALRRGDLGIAADLENEFLESHRRFVSSLTNWTVASARNIED